MPDICTLIIATTTTLQLCYSDNVCRTDGERQLCTGAHQIACGGIKLPTYECKRPDGSTYIYTDKNPQSVIQLNR